jgi:hypothetical protein
VDWRTSPMLVANCLATFSLHEGDFETQQPNESFAADKVSEFTFHLQASYQMIHTPKRMRFLDPKEKVPVKSEFINLRVPSPGNLGPSRVLLGALPEHQTQLELVCTALQVSRSKTPRRPLSWLACTLRLLQGSVGVTGSSSVVPMLWQSAKELSDRTTVQETKPWRVQLDIITASVE